MSCSAIHDVFVFECYGDPRDLHVLTHSFPTRRSSDLLPDYDYLVDYEPPVVTRVHAGDGRLLAEFARNERVFVPIEAIPKRVVKAFLAAEDKNFYEHPGVDFVGEIGRAHV